MPPGSAAWYSPEGEAARPQAVLSVPSTALVQPKLSCLQPSAQLIRAISSPAEGPEETAFGHIERSSLEIADPYGRSDAAIVPSATDVDVEFASLDSDVLVSLDVRERQFARCKVDVEICARWYLNRARETFVAGAVLTVSPSVWLRGPTALGSPGGGYSRGDRPLRTGRSRIAGLPAIRLAAGGAGPRTCSERRAASIASARLPSEPGSSGCCGSRSDCRD
jgi:hypothetical protein